MTMDGWNSATSDIECDGVVEQDRRDRIGSRRSHNHHRLSPTWCTDLARHRLEDHENGFERDDRVDEEEREEEEEEDRL